MQMFDEFIPRFFFSGVISQSAVYFIHHCRSAANLVCAVFPVVAKDLYEPCQLSVNNCIEFAYE